MRGLFPGTRSSAFVASSASAQQLVIYSATPDLSARTLSVTGENFGDSPSAEINQIPVSVLSGSPRLLTLELPASVIAQPGSYLLGVKRGNRATDNDVFSITIGAVGP